jgi:hypothetical protein
MRATRNNSCRVLRYLVYQGVDPCSFMRQPDPCNILIDRRSFIERVCQYTKILTRDSMLSQRSRYLLAWTGLLQDKNK